ncbi:MAG: trypsin-like peptidase domain-containing protein [Saprospiraceae bacterium]|nr:trypsin-like peptidase domain-containing protein [Saprospiraceae bacterium]
MSNWNQQLTTLNRILANLYPQKDQSIRIVDTAGLPLGNIPFKDAPIDNWYYILKEASLRNAVNRIANLASEEYPQNEDLKNIFDEINNNSSLQNVGDLKIDHLKFLISEGKTKEVIKELLEVAPKISSDFHTSIIMQSAKFRSLENDNTLGILNKNDYDISKARINHAILSLLDDVPNELRIRGIIESLGRSEPDTTKLKKVDLLVPEKSELEKVIGREELFEISWLTKALNASRSVCKVQLSNGESGTGFLLKGGYLVTNNHVIDSVETASKSKIIFNYRVDDRDNVQERVQYRLDPSFFITASEETLDYTVVKVMDKPDSPLSDWGFLEPDTFPDPKIGDKVNIIQHPEGNYMKIALPDAIISVWDNYLFYIADTKGGSSGSPVFNQDWKVIALHHAGINEDSAQGGMQINKAGEIKPSNRGILIGHIIDDLKSKGFNFLDSK